MKRAYNYFFGGSSVPQPPSPTSPVTTEATKAPAKDDKSAPRDAGVDTPPQTPAREDAPATPGAKDVEQEQEAEPAGK